MTRGSAASPTRPTGSRGWSRSCCWWAASARAAPTPGRCPDHRCPRPPGLGRAVRDGFVVPPRRHVRRLARGGRRRPARPGPVGAARQRRQVRRGHRRCRRSASMPRTGRSGRPSPLAAPGLSEADRDWLFERFARGETGRATGRRQWPRPVRVARADARHGRRPLAGPGRARPRGEVPADPPRRTAADRGGRGLTDGAPGATTSGPRGR